MIKVNDQSYEISFESNELKKKLDAEWLCTNSFGTYASGSVSGHLSRRYHGYFILGDASLKHRKLILSKTNEVLKIADKYYFLSADHWKNQEKNYSPYLKKFKIINSFPEWTYEINQIIIIKKILLDKNSQNLKITYKIQNLSMNQIDFYVDIFANYREHHELNLNPQVLSSELNANEFKIIYQEKDLLFINHNFSYHFAKNIIYYNYFFEEEFKRGFDFLENNKLIFTLSEKIINNKELEITASTSKEELIKSKFNEDLSIKIIPNYPDWINILNNQKDCFIVKDLNKKEIKIVAGFPWFNDWGRDTFISLYGIFLFDNRFREAEYIFTRYTNHLFKGLIPNQFPDAKETPDYNSVDASLWLFEALFLYFKKSKNKKFINTIIPKLENIIESFVNGTIFDIYMDKDDFLLCAGNKNTQVTWMDAKFGDIVFTPRNGKAIEINCLWYNAIVILSIFLKINNCKSYKKYYVMAQKIKKSIQKFWDKENFYFYDTINNEIKDNSLRPNQIFSISLSFSPITLNQKKDIIDVTIRKLISPYGLRTLASESNKFKPKYSGTPFERDSAYHQGTVWPWLLGHFSISYYKVTKNKDVSLFFLEQLKSHLSEHGIFYISEIFDATYPFSANGCIAQAWSLACILQAYQFVDK